MISKPSAHSLLKSWATHREFEVLKECGLKGGSLIPESGGALPVEGNVYSPPPFSKDTIDAVNNALKSLHSTDYQVIRSVYVNNAPDNNPRLGQALDAFCQKYTG